MCRNYWKRCWTFGREQKIVGMTYPTQKQNKTNKQTHTHTHTHKKGRKRERKSLDVMNVIRLECKRSQLKEALKLDPSSYMSLLQLCIDKKVEKAGHLIHSRILINGYESDIHISTKLIIFYFKVNKILSARRVFDKMSARNIVSWTAMVSGYTRNGRYKDALSVFLEMRRVGIRANQFTYGSALKACSGMRFLEGGKQIQGCVEKGRFKDNLFVKSVLLDLHAKYGRIEDACFLFESMRERDLVCWNSMIGGYAFQGFVDDSYRLFQSMMREGKIPDCFTFGSVLRACVGDCCLMKVGQIHGLINKLGFVLSTMLTGLLIYAYAKCGSIRSAYHIYKYMLNKDVISCTALITGFAREGRDIGEALYLFKEMILMKMGVDDVILCFMLNQCADMASLSLGRQIHALAFKSQATYDMAMGNALIDMYAKSGEIRDANRAFDEMEEKNVISWTSMITAHGMHGSVHKAIALYEKMKCEGCNPNDVTYLALLFACSHTGLTSEGWKIFNNMVSEHNLAPRDEHFSCIVDLLARGGQIESAYDMIREMNIEPSVSVWGAILGACNIYGNISLGEIAARNLLNMEPEKSTNYVGLSSLYAAAGAWDDAWETRKLMQQRSIRKNPGQSLLLSTEKTGFLLEPG